MNRRSPRLPTLERPRWTPRQLQVLDLLVKRRSNREIADELGISLDGAKWHVSEIISTLGVESREDAAEYWRAHNGLPSRFARALRALFPSGLATKVAGAAVVVLAIGIASVALALSQADDSKSPPSALDERTAIASSPSPTRTQTAQPTTSAAANNTIAAATTEAASPPPETLTPAVLITSTPESEPEPDAATPSLTIEPDESASVPAGCETSFPSALCLSADSVSAEISSGGLAAIIARGEQLSYVCGDDGVPVEAEYSEICRDALPGETRDGFRFSRHGSHGGPVTGSELLALLTDAAGGASPGEPISIGCPLNDDSCATFALVWPWAAHDRNVWYLIFDNSSGSPQMVAAGLSGDNADTMRTGGITQTAMNLMVFKPIRGD